MEIEVKHIKAAMDDLKFQGARQADDIKARADRQDAKLDALIKKDHEMDGAKRLLMLLAGAMGAIGGFIGWLLSNWKS